MGPAFQKQLRACGWWTINREKLRRSPADYCVFVLQGFASRSVDFVVIPRVELWRRLGLVHRHEKIIQAYIWVTERERCWETRGLNRAEQLQIAHGDFQHRHRDLSLWLNNWRPVAQLNR